MTIAAIDQGTTSTRVLVIDGAGSMKVAHQVEHRQLYPRPGWVEHDPVELLANLRACIAAAGPVDAIGISNQGESVVAWDSISKRPLGNVIVWQDARTADHIEQLRGQGAERLTLERAGLPLDAYFSASKLAWILENVPEAKELLRHGRLRLGTTDSFFLDSLAGVYATDATTASRTSLMDLRRQCWDVELCRWFGVPITALAEIRPSVAEFGGIVVNGRKVPITAALVDQQAALYGHGCRRAGDAKITFGTGAFALALCGGEPLASPEHGLLATLAWQIRGQPPLFAVDGGVYTAAAAVNWARSLRLFDDFTEIAGFPGAAAIDRGLVFVPALAGLACPHWDRRARGLWLGMTLDSTRQDLCQALLEGIALRSAEVIEAMAALTPIGQRISIDGGLSRNPYFVGFLADALGREVEVARLADLTAYGCGLLAGLGAGIELAPAAAETGGQVVAPRAGIDRKARLQRFRAVVERAKSWS